MNAVEEVELPLPHWHTCGNVRGLDVRERWQDSPNRRCRQSAGVILTFQNIIFA
jgi:hypothetical protein